MKHFSNPGNRSRRLSGLLSVGVLAATALTAFGTLTAPTAAQADPPSHPPVVVSLTYDDGIADQMIAAQLMAQYGMAGTFYLNSGRLGIADRISVADAHTLQNAGNEIGGHTVSHADLPTLDPQEAARQVCNDRVNLLNNGLQVSNFAYPYGDENPSVQQIVTDCGYNSARGIGGVVSPGTCNGCPYNETIPPASTYAMDTPDSIKPSTSLEDMQNYVLQAEQHSGGWVILAMHHICDGCDPYGVAPALLEAFLGWLAQRAEHGTTVKTVAQVIGGEVKPPVNGPPPPPPLATANLLRNHSMESDSNGDTIPDCWQRGGFGTNTAAWSAVSDAHEGTKAQRVDITSYTNGDRKMISPLDLGSCAPSTVPGHRYRVGGWYKATGKVRLVSYYRDSADRWVFFAQSPWLPASPQVYGQAVWTTPAMPAGSKALSVGLSLQSVGFLVGDDFMLTDTDQTVPTVALTAPGDGTRARGTVTFTATAADASGVDHVDFLVDGEVACTVQTAPYRCDYDTTTKPDSVIAVTARAVDTARNVGLSEGRNYTVSNSVEPDTTAPTVTVASPADGSTVSQTVTLTADATDDDAVSQVLFYVNGEQVGAANTAPYDFAWDSASVPDGAVTVHAKALDLLGNVGDAPAITLIVDNYALDTVAPASAITCNGGACAAGWYKTTVSVALSATDGGSGVNRIVYTTDGTEPTDTNGTEYTGAFALSTSTVVRYRARDNAGNVEEVQTRDLRIDTVPPSAAVAAPAAGATVTGIVYIKAGVSDSNGISRVYFYLDDRLLGSRTITPYQWKWDTGPVTDGPHTIYVVAVDPAGNQKRSASITITVT